MNNSTQFILIVGVGLIAALLIYSAVNLRRETSKYQKSDDKLHTVGNKVWAHLIPAQQEELAKTELLVDQEEWIELNVDPVVLDGITPEKLLVFYANRGLLLLGKGTFRRHMSPLDFIPKPEEPLTDSEQPESALPVTEEVAEQAEDSAPSDAASSDDSSTDASPASEEPRPRKGKKVTYRVKK